EITALDLAVLDQPPGDKLRGIDSDRKADALRRQDDRGVHPDDLAVGRDQRAAGISGIQRCVRLNDVIDESSGLRSKRPAERAHYARRDGRFETIWVSYRDHELANSNRMRITKSNWRQIGRSNANDGQIRIRVVADFIRFVAISTRKDD